jgi:hypothetical protein
MNAPTTMMAGKNQKLVRSTSRTTNSRVFIEENKGGRAPGSCCFCRWAIREILASWDGDKSRLGADSNLLKNAFVAFFNIAKWEAKLPTAHKITIYGVILRSASV